MFYILDHGRVAEKPNDRTYNQQQKHQNFPTKATAPFRISGKPIFDKQKSVLQPFCYLPLLKHKQHHQKATNQANEPRMSFSMNWAGWLQEVGQKYNTKNAAVDALNNAYREVFVLSLRRHLLKDFRRGWVLPDEARHRVAIDRHVPLLIVRQHQVVFQPGYSRCLKHVFICVLFIWIIATTKKIHMK